MQALTRFSLKRASIIIMLTLMVTAGGLFSAMQLKSELLPNIDLPVMSVVAVYPGAAPDDVRRDVTEPIEKQIAGVANLKTLTSVSNDSVAFVTAEFEYGTDMEKAQQTVEENVNRLTLPSQVQRPTVGRFNFQDIPVLAYTVNTQDEGEDALSDLRRALEDKVVPDLKAIPGVNSVSVAGGGTKEVQITFNEEELTKNGLTSSGVTGVLQANNISFPTGDITDNGQSIPVRVTNQFTTLDDLRSLVVRPAMPKPAATGAGAGAGSGSGTAPGATQPITNTGSGSGAAPGATQPGATQPITNTGAGTSAAPTAQATPQMLAAVKLSDVADVDLVNAGGESISRSNSKPSLSLVIYKTQNANTVQVADSVNAHMETLGDIIPGAGREILFDQSTFIKESLDGLFREGILGAVLAIIVVLIFLGSLKSTLVTAVSIPLSVLIALMMFNVFGVTLNIMSLAGLAVAIGRVVDDSIVVLENIYRHHFQRGEPLRQAAFNGTREVATAITASTITTVCVFLPLGFIAGLVSEFFRPFAVAVTISLLASLLVALTVIPVLAVFFLRTRPGSKAAISAARKAHTEERDTWIQRAYTPAITFVLKNAWTKLGTIALALILFVASMFLVPYIGTTFITVGSDKVLQAEVQMKPGTDLASTDRVSRTLEDEIQKHDTVNNYQVTIGSNTAGAAGGFAALGNSSTSNLTVTLDREADIRAEADWLRNLIKSKQQDLGIEDYRVTTGSGAGFNSSSFSVVVSGSNYDDVIKTADTLETRLHDVPNLVNVTSDAARGKSEIRVKVDPEKALQHGSTTVQIAGQVRGLLTSQKVTQMTIGGQLYDVQAVYDKSTLDDIEAIKDIRVGTVNPVPLEEVADVSMADGPVSITRVNQEQAVTVKGTINSDSTNGVTAAAQKVIDELNPPTGTEVTISGVSAQQAESFGQMGVALLVAIVLVYLVMVLTFGSLSTPFIIMFSIPLAAIGSIVALFVTGRPLGVSALIGVLMLVGIVVTNAIVLLDLVEQLKKRGFDTRDALIQGGRTRVRPIIMTAVATMFALVPLVLGFSEGSIIAAELGTVVVGGLFSSTFLTLIVVPVAYSLLDSLRNRLGGNRGATDELDALDVAAPANGVEHDLSGLEQPTPAGAH
jgi:hydrophobic/amphiphilic exporter-1 (mainly G- bacteria), HAE1 family